LKKYIKIIIYILCGIAYSDLIFNPQKGFHFISFFDKIQIPIVILLLSSLITIIVNEIPENKFKTKIEKFKIPSMITFLICSLLILNEVFFNFHFNQEIEFLIALIFSIPIPFIVSELITTSKINKTYFLLFGLILTITTAIFFKFVYEPYEDYWNETPIIFVHQWIRNWLIFIGLNLIIIYSLLRNKEKNYR
jgi:uncharacterized membrane protein